MFKTQSPFNHYRQAEECISRAEEFYDDSVQDRPRYDALVACAQVHATLALMNYENWDAFRRLELMDRS